MLYVGIDWAHEAHAVCLLDAQGQLLAQQQIPDTVQGFRTLQALCAAHAATPEEVVIGIETAHGLLVRALRAAGYRLYAINPMVASRYRARYAISGAKSDETDARMLADLVRSDHRQLRELSQDAAEVAALGTLTRTHKRLVWEQQRHANQLRQTLREYYPAALAAVGEALADPIALVLLARAPTPALGRQLSQRQLVSLLRRAGAQRGLETRAAQVQAALRTAHWEQPPPLTAALGTTTQALVAVLQTLARQIATLQDALTAQFEAHPDAELIRSLPGLGKILGARVLAEFGDTPTGYADSRARKCVAGTAPVTRASGKRRTVGRRRATNTWLLDACMRWAFCSLTQSAGARAYYDQLRARGKPHQAALRALANRWVGILHGCLRHRSLYDEALAWPAVALLETATKPRTIPEKPSKKPGIVHGSVSTLQHSA